jgi:hypothetical protein
MWSAEISYVIDAPPASDKEARVEYTRASDGEVWVGRYSLSPDRFPDMTAIEDFVQTEIDRLNAEDLAAEADAAAVANGDVE